MQTTPHATADAARHDALLTWAATELRRQNDRLLLVAPMQSAASYRRFFRLTTEQGSRVLMDSRPDKENNAQFERLSRHFGDHGIPVPRLLAHDVDKGFLLVTDLGATHLGDVYGTSAEASAIEAALRVLIDIQALESSSLIPEYSRTRLLDEYELFPTWLIERFLQRVVQPAERALLDEARERLIDQICAQPRRCVHRDFHSRNLIWHDGRIGLVDFQDALWGPQCYDLASLLRDCYHRFSEAQIDHWRARYAELASAAGVLEEPCKTMLAKAVDWTAVQRQIKAVGIFARLKLRDGRDTHLRDIAPVIDHLIDVTAAYAEFASLSHWLEESVKPAVAQAMARLP